MRYLSVGFCLLLTCLPYAVARDAYADQLLPNRDTVGSHPSVELPQIEPSRRVSAPERIFRGMSDPVGTGIAGFAQNVLEGLTLQFRAPFSYAKRNPLKFAAGATGVLALIATDHLTYPRLTTSSGSDLQRLMRRVSGAGQVANGLLFVAGIGLTGVLTGSSREKETSVMLAEALITSAAWTATMKAVSGRERPRELAELRSDWEGPVFLNSSDRPQSVGLRSFPSGHSTGAWATATVLAHQYPDYSIVPIFAFGAAATVSYSRIAVGAHWLSDVVVGALIGITSARQVLIAHERRAHRQAEPTDVRFGVHVSSHRKGVYIEYGF